MKTLSVPTGAGVRGAAASAVTGKLYIAYGPDSGSGGSQLAYDLATDTVVWTKTYNHGIDSLAMSPDGAYLFVGDTPDVTSASSRTPAMKMPLLANTRVEPEIDFQGNTPVWAMNMRSSIGLSTAIAKTPVPNYAFRGMLMTTRLHLRLRGVAECSESCATPSKFAGVSSLRGKPGSSTPALNREAESG